MAPVLQLLFNQRNTKSKTEAQLILALQALKCDPNLSIRKAASLFSVSASSLSYRKRGRASRRDCLPNLQKLTNLEEQAIIQRVFKLDF